MGGQLEFALSTAILLESEEVAAAMQGPGFAREVMNFLDLATASGFVRHFTPQFHFRIITADPDDHIFADCVVAADAQYIITEDRHFGALRNAGDKPQPITPEDGRRRLPTREFI